MPWIGVCLLHSQGQNRKSPLVRVTSAYPPGADMGRRARHVCYPIDARVYHDELLIDLIRLPAGPPRARMADDRRLTQF